MPVGKPVGTGSNSYRDLEVWQKAIALAQQLYRLTETFPKKEIFGLSSQLTRSGVSVASNIAEGQARNSKKEFIHFLNISLGSLAEIETQLIIAHGIGYVSEADQNTYLHLTDELTRMIKGLINHLKKTH